jgi:hypothetical protein
MRTSKMGQSLRLVMTAASACALVACVENAVPPSQVPRPATKDVCEEATEYGRRVAAADSEQVRAALQRIANTKSRECAAKTSVSVARGTLEPSPSTSK